MVTTEKFLDDLFSKAAKEAENEQKDKHYKYEVYSDDFSSKLKGSGICKVVSRRYSKALDCDVLTCIDLETNEKFSYNQFAIELEEIR